MSVLDTLVSVITSLSEEQLLEHLDLFETIENHPHSSKADRLETLIALFHHRPELATANEVARLVRLGGPAAWFPLEKRVNPLSWALDEDTVELGKMIFSNGDLTSATGFLHWVGPHLAKFLEKDPGICDAFYTVAGRSNCHAMVTLLNNSLPLPKAKAA